MIYKQNSEIDKVCVKINTKWIVEFKDETNMFKAASR